jgi:hypothetical protein
VKESLEDSCPSFAGRFKGHVIPHQLFEILAVGFGSGGKTAPTELGDCEKIDQGRQAISPYRRRFRAPCTVSIFNIEPTHSMCTLEEIFAKASTQLRHLSKFSIDGALTGSTETSGAPSSPSTDKYVVLFSAHQPSLERRGSVDSVDAVANSSLVHNPALPSL